MDKTTEPYDYLKLALYEGRVSMYNYPIVLQELEDLQRDQTTHQVIHLPQGSKDVADSLAGVVYTLSTQMHERAPISVGISVYEGDREKVDSAWVRETMQHLDKGPVVKVGDVPPHGGPVIVSG